MGEKKKDIYEWKTENEQRPQQGEPTRSDYSVNVLVYFP